LRSSKNDDVGFVPHRRPVALRPGLVIRESATGGPTYHRVTHVFERSIYWLEISTPEKARYARRPRRARRSSVETDIQKGIAETGTVKLPARFHPQSTEAPEAQYKDAMMSALEPLLAAFKEERNLGRWTFTAKIEERAKELSMSAVSLRRVLLRYWYFGGVREALMRLPRGPRMSLERSATVAPNAPQKRRGPQARTKGKLGKNKFIVQPIDIEDMVDALRWCAKHRITTWEGVLENYLGKRLSARHPALYRSYMAEKVPRPVTLRQLRYYIGLETDLEEAILAKFPTLRKGGAAKGRSSSLGPGDIYEADATGGQINVVDSRDPTRILAKVIIYLIIDRWSRFIVSVYATLKPASSKALRTALRIAFTSRSRRFRALGVPIDDKRWPVGVVPATLTVDRGSDMISEATLHAAVDDLLIVADVLKPQYPDGKAIIERTIRTLKDRMRRRGMRGRYVKFPTNPKARKQQADARRAAVNSLKDVYRALVEVGDEHNHRTHKALKVLPELKLAGVPPVPAQAYIWGLEHLTGLERPPLAEADYARLTMTTVSATLANGEIRLPKFRYLPANEAAARIARRSTSKGKQVDALIDESDPFEIFTHLDSDPQAVWTIDEAGKEHLENITLEEEEEFRENFALIADLADNRAMIERLQKSSMPGAGRSRKSTNTRLRSTSESEALDKELLGRKGTTRAKSRADEPPPNRLKDTINREQDEEEALIQRRRKERGK